MRQAGRYLKQYRQIRDKHGILEICKRPDLAATVTLQPVEILDVDAAIIFADLLLPVEPMGLKLRYAKGEGPVIDNPVRTSDDVDSLSTANTDDLGYVGEAIQQRGAGAGRQGAGDRLRGRALHHGQLHDRRRRVAQFHPHQEADVQRRDAVAAAGKGYAVDRMVDVLRQKGVQIALVAGSDSSIYGMGAPPTRAEGLAGGDQGPVAPQTRRWPRRF